MLKWNVGRCAFGISFLIFSSLIVGCAESQEASKAPTPKYDFPVFNSKSTASLKSQLENANLYCRHEGTCPENVGMIAFITGRDEDGNLQIGRCTGFLIGKNIVATNSHCLTDLKENGSDCPSNLAIKFAPSKKEKAETFACKKFLFRSTLEKESLRPDYGYFEIEPTARTPVKVRRASLPDRLGIRVTKVDPVLDNWNGTMYSSTCPTVQHSTLLTAYNNDWSELGIGIGCHTVGGNSGSPVYDDATGEVIGIAYGRISEENWANHYLTEVANWIDNMPAQRPEVVHFTNFGCALDSQGRLHNEAECAEGKKKSASSSYFTKRTSDAIFSIVEKKWQEWSRRLPSVAVFETYYLSFGPIVGQAMPICVRPLEQWPTDLAMKAKNLNGSTLRLSYEGNIRFDRKASIDEFFVANTNPSAKDRADIFQLELTFESDGTISMASLPGKGAYKTSKVVRKSLSWCTNDQLRKGNHYVEKELQ